MKYIFIFNGLPSRQWVIPEVVTQLKGLDIQFSCYTTTDAGDATRYVNVYCDLNSKDEVCFVACGGAGLVNEVVSGIVNRENKSLGILSYGGTNDFTKVFPELNFQSVKNLVNGKMRSFDVIKVNDNYALNTVNAGMDAMIISYGQDYIAAGMPKAYAIAIHDALLANRLNHVQIVADGEVISRRVFMDAEFCNGRWCGGVYHCAPYAEPDDGLMDLVVFKPAGLLPLAYLMKKLRAGEHLTDKFCKRFITYRRVRHIEMRSKDLFYLAVDGEILGVQSADIDILPKAVKMIVPEK